MNKNRKVGQFIGGFAAAVAVTVSGMSIADDSLKIQSAWPLTLPSSGRDAQNLADALAQVSSDLSVKLYSAGKLVPPLQIFDAVSNGTLDAGFTSPLYVAGRYPAVQLFGGVPFGPGTVEYMSWIYQGGGLELWREIYGKAGVYTIPCSLMEPEAGGWYKKKIETVEDIKGLKVRFAGLAGDVMKDMGASVVLLSSGDIFPSLERGVIDGTEFSMPVIDKAIGLHKAAKYYYVPGWHQPAAINELIINQAKWDSLSAQNQARIENACQANLMKGVLMSFPENAQALEEFKTAGVEVMSFSDDVLASLKLSTERVMGEQAASDESFGVVLESLNAWRAKTEIWSRNSHIKALD